MIKSIIPDDGLIWERRKRKVAHAIGCMMVPFLGTGNTATDPGLGEEIMSWRVWSAFKLVKWGYQVDDFTYVAILG